ncbi:MAG: RluA family pseudouridine synthase [Phycisphaerales bacterium]
MIDRRRPDSPGPDPVPEWIYTPPPGPPPIVHEDCFTRDTPAGPIRAGFVVIDKPAGLLAVPGVGPEKADCARSRVLDLYPWATGPMTVHRLDLATSGLLVLALDADTHRNLSVQFERRRPTKRYLALVEGHLAADAGLIDVPMRKDFDRPPTQLVDWRDGKPSQTHWRVLARETLAGDPVTRLELTPETGRTHQLRVHAAHPRVVTVGVPPADHPMEHDGLGAPIVGDDLYAARPADRLMLHAWTLTLNHPITGKMMSFWSEAPF